MFVNADVKTSKQTNKQKTQQVTEWKFPFSIPLFFKVPTKLIKENMVICSLGKRLMSRKLHLSVGGKSTVQIVATDCTGLVKY